MSRMPADLLQDSLPTSLAGPGALTRAPAAFTKCPRAHDGHSGTALMTDPTIELLRN
jgi:hypothetical protein